MMDLLWVSVEAIKGIGTKCGAVCFLSCTERSVVKISMINVLLMVLVEKNQMMVDKSQASPQDSYHLNSKNYFPIFLMLKWVVQTNIEENQDSKRGITFPKDIMKF